MVWLPHWPRIGEMRSMKFSLDRMCALMALLGNPQDHIPPVIHVGGTNGKGSTVAFIRSILEASGRSVHVFTSPHLERFNERIVLGGRSEISDNLLYSLLEECRFYVEKHGLEISFFEGITAAAFLAFARSKADVTLLEVGLGGRLDATNVIKQSLASVITSISYDHMNVLGNSLAEIAVEKSGIMRAGGTSIISMQTPEVNDALEACATKVGTKLVQFEYDYGVFLEGESVRYKSADLDFIIPRISLQGYHQFVNAATAISTVREIFGNAIQEEDIIKGVAKAKWKGRLQKIESGLIFTKIPKDWEVWLDCAHNPAGAQTLGAWLDLQEELDTYFIFSMTRNRDVNEFLVHIRGLRSVVCSNIKSEPLAYQGKQIPPLILDESLRARALVAETMDDAIDEIIKHQGSLSRARILIAGSMYLVSDFLKYNANIDF